METLQLLNKADLREAIMEVMLPLIQEMQQKSFKAGVPSGEDELLTRKEAAAYLKITLVTLNAWTRQGIIKSRRICGRVNYNSSELKQLPK